VDVAVDPYTAFQVFVEDVNVWWRRGPQYRFLPPWDAPLKFEGGKGGRLVQESRSPGGHEFEVGRIREWSPGERLVLEWRLPNFASDQSTEVEIQFEAREGGTRVTLEHRGWENIPLGHQARHGLKGRAFVLLNGQNWADNLRDFRVFCSVKSEI
jgi:uncharacterized protein YndB with AHSA1/START domain